MADKDLIHQAKQGDADAIDGVMASSRERLERLAAFYGRRCGEDAGDLEQEGWLGLLEGLKVVNTSIGEPQIFLLKRARWRMLDYIKWSRRRQHLPLEQPGEYEMLEDEAEHDPHGQACCDSFVSRLPDRQREIVRLLTAGYTWREAAAQLGCTSANVAYHVRRIQEAYAEWCAADDGREAAYPAMRSQRRRSHRMRRLVSV